jgi:hypothetical protein
MDSQRPIDRKRQSAFSGTVGVDGEGQIRESFSIGRTLLILKDEAIYEFELADQIDPGRTNIDVPHVQQKRYSVGTSSEIVNRVLMTAKYLFERGLIDSRFEKAVLLEAVLAFFDEIVAAYSLFETFRAEQDAAIAKFEQQKAAGMTLLLPAVGDVVGKAKAFIQRAEHSMQRLLGLCWIFYPRADGKAWFDSVVKHAESSNPEMREKLNGIRNVEKYARFIRNCRHCIEHVKSNQRLNVADFRLTPAAQLEVPTVEVVHPHTPEPKLPLAVFMYSTVESLMRAAEELMAFLAHAHMDPAWKDKAGVVHFLEGERRNPHVRFYFAINMGGKMVPMG